jgi:hypothetical protein
VLPIGNIGFLISNAKAQMSNEYQMTKPKTNNHPSTIVPTYGAGETTKFGKHEIGNVFV